MSPPSKRSKTSSIYQQRWMDRFKQLKTYKKTNGHCIVPQRYAGGLGAWVKSQRERYKKAGKLDNDRISRLESIGFVWKVIEMDNHQLWMARFEELKRYKKTNGHCNVPVRNAGGLGGWVRMQRHNYKKAGKLDNDRISRLESIGFAWKAKIGRRVSEQR